MTVEVLGMRINATEPDIIARVDEVPDDVWNEFFRAVGHDSDWFGVGDTAIHLPSYALISIKEV